METSLIQGDEAESHSDVKHTATFDCGVGWIYRLQPKNTTYVGRGDCRETRSGLVVAMAETADSDMSDEVVEVLLDCGLAAFKRRGEPQHAERTHRCRRCHFPCFLSQVRWWIMTGAKGKRMQP